MPSAARLGDKCSGHSCYSPTPSNSSSGNVIINGKGALRTGDTYEPHSCGSSVHVPIQQKGSGSVIINGKKCARMGDGVACGGVVMNGSGNVIVGD